MQNSKVSVILILMKPLKIIELFDKYLHGKGKTFEAICVGGTALNLLGVISRETQDCDILDPRISQDIKELSKEFAAEVTKSGIDLKNDWLNNGPASLSRDLTGDWKAKIQIAFQGDAITLYTLGRLDLIKSKVFALCDRAIDRDDCLKLHPTRLELEEILPWLTQQDANLMWPEHVKETLSELAKELGYEL